ncbi:hypothetical protein B0T16DRAFT_320047 [Cercophora newfieldiana]|uniref:Uncharacterized protein n=1 Tax=Cercophora newfieldiana TaxID=92897 RepID=A0AA40CZ14_9PEZI|nr:hypothetical protein B0T16DRAFT_320047 [Cercophora newfieldiana]
MSVKPTLSLSTPVTANFPQHPPSASELRSAISLPSAISERTPLSAVSRSSAFRDPMRSGLPSAGLPSAGPYSARLGFEELQKTPITPPVAYLDFLKSMSLVSPSIASSPQRASLHRVSTVSSADSNVSSNKSEASTNSEESEKDKGEQIDSGPSTARTEVSCECADHKEPEEAEKKPEKLKTRKADGRPKSPPAPINTKLPPTPSGSHYPLSAPAAGPDVFPSMKLPASPAVSAAGLYSPRSPLSAASVKSPFDWEAALKSRRVAEPPKSAGCKRSANSETPTTPKAGPTSPTHTKRESRSSIRHIREVVTRTVTYTPRMAPAPKGKRRKLDNDSAVGS